MTKIVEIPAAQAPDARAVLHQIAALTASAQDAQAAAQRAHGVLIAVMQAHQQQLAAMMVENGLKPDAFRGYGLWEDPETGALFLRAIE